MHGGSFPCHPSSPPSQSIRDDGALGKYVKIPLGDFLDSRTENDDRKDDADRTIGSMER